MTHQQPDEGGQSRTALADGNSRGKIATGGNATTGTRNAMLLILDDDWLDQRQIPDLVPDRLGVCPFQDVTTSSAMIGNASNDIVALFRGNELTAMLAFHLAGKNIRAKGLKISCMKGMKPRMDS